MGNFYTDVIQRDSRFETSDRVHDPLLLCPVVRAAILAIIQDAAAMGIPLMLFESFRSVHRQEILFQIGATQLEVVGVHHYGLAADLTKVYHGQASWQGDFSFMTTLARKHGLISGYDWGQPGVHHSFVDPCHLQLPAVAMQEQLFAGTWWPSDDYSPWHGVAVA